MDNIRLENFRSIEDSGEIKLKPITIFVGKNGVGKSSIMRLFPLIKQSVAVSKRGPILWYSENGVDFGDFNAVVTHGKKEVVISFSMEYGIARDMNFDVYVSLTIVAENKKGEEMSYDRVESMILKFLGNEVIINFDSLEDSVSEGKAYVRINDADFKEASYDYMLAGIFPIVRPNNEDTIVGFKELIDLLAEDGKYYYREPSDFLGMTFEEFKAKLSEKEYAYNVRTEYNSIVLAYLQGLLMNLAMLIHFEANDLVYIGPFRDAPQRYYRYQNLSTHSIDMRGSNMAVFANALSNKQRGNFNAMAKSHFGFELETENHAGHITVNIRKDGKSTNIVDNGFGYSQMMPVLLALHSFSRRKARRSFPIYMTGQMLCIEQPELHLHPSMQYELGRAFVDAVKNSKEGSDGNKILIETHSRSLIDAIGDAVAEGVVEAEDVAVYVFEKNTVGFASIKQSEFDDQGYLTHWPLGFLD